MRILNTLLASAVLALPTAAFSASVTTIMIGDDDCFGQGAIPCADGTQITAPTAGFDANGVLPFPVLDNSSVLDPAGTDVFDEHGTLSFSFNFSSGGMDVTSASISAKVWGLDLFATSAANGGQFGDAFEGARFQFDGTDIGTYFAPAGPGPNLVDTVMFNIDPNTLTDGTHTISIIPEQDFLQFAGPFFTGKDAFAVDYVKVTAELDDVVVPPAVPLPAGFPLLLGGLAAFGLVRRRRA